MERLDRILCNLGVGSRSEVKRMLKQGRVVVNQKIASSPEEKFDPETAEIIVDGRPVIYEKYIYLLLHKPAGVLTATEDKRQKTVLDLIPEELRRKDLSPVGRLDKDTEGFLLLTNDGELNHRLLSPKYHVDKTYYARVDGCLEKSDVDAFQNGIALKDFTCMPAKLEILSQNECLVVVQEGKFHQVKRMLGARGKEVLYLKRLSMGELKLDEKLQKGAVRQLTNDEVEYLRSIVEAKPIDKMCKSDT